MLYYLVLGRGSLCFKGSPPRSATVADSYDYSPKGNNSIFKIKKIDRFLQTDMAVIDPATINTTMLKWN